MWGWGHSQAEAWAGHPGTYSPEALPHPQYPLISDFGEEHGFSLYEIKDGSLLEVEKVSLQQRLNQFQHEVSLPGWAHPLSILLQSVSDTLPSTPPRIWPLPL